MQSAGAPLALKQRTLTFSRRSARLGPTDAPAPQPATLQLLLLPYAETLTVEANGGTPGISTWQGGVDLNYVFFNN